MLQSTAYPCITKRLSRPIYLTLKDINTREKWVKHKHKRYSGQMKLFFSTLRAFVEFDLKKQVKYTILYIGSAPGSNFYFILKFFSRYNFEVHLYDTASHDKRLEDLQYVTIHRQLFQDEDIAKWKDVNNLIFISDIRSVDSGQEPSLGNIIFDNNLQTKCVLELKPIHSFLKLRYPFPDQVDKDFSFTILEGQENLQIFTSDSNERRLILGKHLKTIQRFHDDLLASEEKMAHYNNYKKKNSDFELEVFQYFMTPVLKDNLIDLSLNSLIAVDTFLKSLSYAIINYKIKNLSLKKRSLGVS